MDGELGGVDGELGEVFPVRASASAWSARASARARRPSATRSRGPIRQRGPVSSRTSESDPAASSSTRSVATTSCTSGTVSRPPSPTTSTGMSRASSARRNAGNWDRLRHKHGDVGRPHHLPAAVRPGLTVGRDPRRQHQQPLDPARHPLGLGRHGVQQRARHPAAALPVRRGLQPGHVGGLGPQLLLQHRRGVQHPAGVAEAGGQQLHRCGPAGHAGRGGRGSTGKSWENRRRLPALAPRHP